jgi:hypothetical protein
VADFEDEPQPDDTFGVKCRYCGEPADGEVAVFGPVGVVVFGPVEGDISIRPLTLGPLPEELRALGVCAACREGKR